MPGDRASELLERPDGARRRDARRRASLVAWLLGALAAAALADEVTPTVSRIYFERHKQPVHARVDFTVRCFGYGMRPGEMKAPAPGYTPQEVFSFSAKCPDYGCEVNEPFYLNYRHIDWCSVEGRSEGRAFKIERYATSPIDFSKCKRSADGSRLCALHLTLPD
jgi:hypothetical protein